MSFSQALGFLGTGLVIIAYIPQITHLVRERCSAGISLIAYVLWLIASLCLLIHALFQADSVFIALQGTQLVTSSIILFFGWKYKDSRCALHRGMAA